MNMLINSRTTLNILGKRLCEKRNQLLGYKQSNTNIFLYQNKEFLAALEASRAYATVFKISPTFKVLCC